MGKKLTYKQPESNATENEKAFAKEVAELLIDLVDLDEEDMIEIKKEKINGIICTMKCTKLSFLKKNFIGS